MTPKKERKKDRKYNTIYQCVFSYAHAYLFLSDCLTDNVQFHRLNKRGQHKSTRRIFRSFAALWVTASLLCLLSAHNFSFTSLQEKLRQVWFGYDLLFEHATLTIQFNSLVHELKTGHCVIKSEVKYRNYTHFYLVNVREFLWVIFVFLQNIATASVSLLSSTSLHSTADSV